MLGQIFLKVMDMSRFAGMIIMVILIVRTLLKRFPKYISYMLWSVVLFRLLCPVTLESRISPVPNLEPVFYEYISGEEADSAEGAGEPAEPHADGMAAGEPTGTHTGGMAAGKPAGPYTNGVGTGKPAGSHISDVAAGKPAKSYIGGVAAGANVPETGQAGLGGYGRVVPVQIQPEENVRAAKASWQELFLLYGKYVWLSGIGIMSLYCVISTVRIRTRVSMSIPLKENIYITDETISPFVMGIFKPRIYLPGGLSGKEQEYIVLHEKFHIRRLDHVVKLVAFAALCIHWFNPLVWIAFALFCKDMEMSCDEAVIKRMGEDIRADYSVSLLALATKRRVPGGIPVDFGEGNTKGRIKNLAAFRKRKKGVLAILVTGVVILILCLASNRKVSGSDATGSGGESGHLSGATGLGGEGGHLSDATGSGGEGIHLSDATGSGGESSQLADANGSGGESSRLSDAGGFGDENIPLTGSNVSDDENNAAEDFEVPEQLNLSLDIAEHYQTHVGYFGNLYYIDENNVLWGSGDNQCGQLGQGTQDYEFHDKPVKIAENVIDVDYSQEGFVIFLTEDHKLYGVGNAGCGALQQYEEFDWTRFINGDHYYMSEPCLLMENVKFARCGRHDVACLTEDGAVWIWGTVNHEGYFLYHDVFYLQKPQKILENAVLVTGGWFNHAALLQDGTVWTWGYNGAGNCGVADTYVVSEPTMVAENVVMVWTDLALKAWPQPNAEEIAMAWKGELGYNMEYEDIAEFGDTGYITLQNTVIQKADGSYWVCGEDVGQEEKLVDGVEMDYYAIYTHEFYPCE